MSQCFDLTRSSSNRVWIGGGLPAPRQLDDDRTYWTNYTCPPRIHLTSFLWQMLLPYFSSLLYFHVLLSYYQLKLKKKRRGRPVNGARKMGAVSMQITVGFAAECNTLSCYVCSTGPVPTIYVLYSLFFQATFEAAHLCCKIYRQLDQFYNLLLGNKTVQFVPYFGGNVKFKLVMTFPQASISSQKYQFPLHGPVRRRNLNWLCQI